MLEVLVRLEESMKEKVEILAPAGSMESLKAAVAAGADAVYTGGMLFGARAYAHNLTEAELLEAIDYVHLHGRKIYLTVNTLLKEREITEKLYGYLLPYYRQGLDAVIVQDIGVFQFIRERFPDLPIHASTQMTITGVDGAKLLEREGAERIVTSRELSIQEVRRIAEETNLEIESFVHGALCYCYSGQCLFSSFLGGRSGNRGQCAQPCRLLYQADGEKKSSYLLSLKDICTLEMIPELIEAGIDSFKIEGRMKKPEYVAAVTFLYRKYADKYLAIRKNCPEEEEPSEYAEKKFAVDKKDKEMLLDLYNRGGFHTGYYHTRNGQEMISLSRPNHAGVPAVRVLRKQGRTVWGKALVDLNAQDVIELPARKGQEKADNYTCKGAVEKGREFSIMVFADTPFQKGMIWNRTRNEKLIQELHEQFVDRKIKEKLNGKFILSAGDFAKLTINGGGISITVTGDAVQEAVNQPMEEARIRRQLQKTGNTEFEFDNLDIEIHGKVFLPMQSLNEIRRKALEEFEKAATVRYRRKNAEAADESVVQKRREKLDLNDSRDCEKYRDEYTVQKKYSGGEMNKYRLFASVQSLKQLEELLQAEDVERIYVDAAVFPHIWRSEKPAQIISASHQKGKEVYLTMPCIFREDVRKKYDESYEHIFAAGWDGVLVRNYESFGFLKEHKFAKPIITDYNLYQFNQYGKIFWREQGASGFTAPLELTARELKELTLFEGELVIYGHLPMMVSAGCIKKTVGNCRKESGWTTITDRYRKEFVVKNECDYCYNVIYNHVPLFLGDLMAEVEAVGAGALRLMFTVENAQEVKRVLELYRRGKEMPDGEFTRGHWKRGIK